MAVCSRYKRGMTILGMLASVRVLVDTRSLEDTSITGALIIMPDGLMWTAGLFCLSHAHIF